MKPLKCFWILLVLLLALDQGSKELVQQFLPRHESIVVIPHVFHLSYVRNTGVAFGMLAGKNYWLAGFTLTVVTLGVWWARQLDWKRAETNVIAAMLLSGAIGNLIDRVRYGYVVDFMDFGPIGYVWVFNVADSCITLSLVWIIFRQCLPEKKAAFSKN